MTDVTQSGWRRFWEKGGWWRALVLVVVYFVLYNGLSLLLTPLASQIDDPQSAEGLLVFYVIPILVGSLLLVAFAASVGWLKEVFAPQPIRGRGWMWIAIVVVLLFNVLHFLSVDYGAAGFEVVATWLLAGVFIGFAEEVLTRGLVVNLLRKAGQREIAVAAISSALFALLHAGNLLTGQSLFATAIQLVYTFGFGVCMYLAMRVTGTIIAPILLHASTDPSIFLYTAYPVDGGLGALAGLGNPAVIIVGIVLLFFIRGRVQPTSSAPQFDATR
ncbi:CPBP family intramembrane glutamic endopeptidase [Microbacterium phyllosphaerae]|uniref:CPBP family intramembrane glutamic endopeptidase n=1 Tax=Microbacterium phyllosphaerae TaxID=124798 RepID=UPI002169A8DE|nr:CPBP family intramembrane glutamic endopeptidase [Microbacterium phyllosphaerae]MCS3444097.1 membrane protease YdiL (CAAX protease family) [Microbacterium phyllosphaerae]